MSLHMNMYNQIQNKTNECYLRRSKGAYIKYVGGGAGGFYKFSKENFIAQ